MESWAQQDGGRQSLCTAGLNEPDLAVKVNGSLSVSGTMVRIFRRKAVQQSTVRSGVQQGRTMQARA